MAKLVYRNVPYNQAGQTPGTVVIDDSMPAWVQAQWKTALAAYTPDDPIYEPTFLDASVSVPDGLGNTITQSVGISDPDHFVSLFATKETAQEMATRFGAGEVREIDPGYGGGVVMNPAKAYGISVKDGRILNAGMLASIFVRFNASDNGALADQFIKTLIAGGK